MKTFILALMILASLSACGRRGDPTFYAPHSTEATQ